MMLMTGKIDTSYVGANRIMLCCLVKKVRVFFILSIYILAFIDFLYRKLIHFSVKSVGC